MYLRDYRLWKYLLENYLKGTTSEQALAANMWERPTTAREISMRVVLSCSFIILRDVDLEYVSPSVWWNLEDVC